MVDKKRKMTLAIVAIVFIICIFIIVILINPIFASTPPSQSNSEGDIEMENLYTIQNSVLSHTTWSTYQPFYETNQNVVYCDLVFYYQEMGKTLTLEDIISYLSSEFETDGTIRIYNNGNWPEINEYIQWAQKNEEQRDSFIKSVMHQQVQLEATYPELKEYYLDTLSLHNLKEIIASMEDESYEPNFIFE